jgi:hypothetical protein
VELVGPEHALRVVEAIKEPADPTVVAGDRKVAVGRTTNGVPQKEPLRDIEDASRRAIDACSVLP